jgi:hypothetical protein
VATVWRAGLLLVACLATVASADDPRDAFGFKKKPKPVEKPLDCGDGTAFGCTTASDRLDEHGSRLSLSTWLPASYLLSLPVADASHDAVAHYALGAGRDDAGVSIAGATGLENRWTIDGAPADGMRAGGADTRVPLLFLDGIFVNTGGFTARDRVSTGGTIDARLRRGTKTHEVDVRGWAGFSLESRRIPIAPSTYFVRRGTLDAGPEGTLAAVATGPLGELLGGAAWYAAGLGAEVVSLKFGWTAGTVRDRDLDGNIDGLPGVVPTERVDHYTRTPVTWRAPLLLRGGWTRGAHELDATIVGSAGTDVRYLYNSTLQAAGVNGTSIVGDAIATWRGAWKATRARAQLAWHRSMRSEEARNANASNRPQLLSAYVPGILSDDPALAAACFDSVDPALDRYPDVTNCPVPVGWFASGGAGPLSDVTGDRPSLTADVAHAFGNNVVRIGATGEDTRLVTETRFTGGSQIRSLFPGHSSERRFADPNELCNADVTLPCPTVPSSVLRWRTRYTAAYVEDTWHATDNLSVDGGLRWELMWVGTALHFSDQLAPRLGIGWDPVGGGRSRVWATMGRSFAMLPAGLGNTILSRERTVDHIESQFGEGRSVDTGSVVGVASGVDPITQDELTAGAQVAIARTVRATVWLQGRWLSRGLDTTPTGLDNPGRNGGTPASRETGLVAAELATAPTAKLALRAGYMYGRTIGSWTGAFDPREGAVLYAGSAFDVTSVNLMGRLPTDIGHRTYIEAERGGSIGSGPDSAKLAVALRLTAGSGRPRSALATTDDEGLVYLLPRGSVGRGPLVTQANVRLAASWHSLDITLDLFNVFNRREATSVDEVYAVGPVRAIDNGTREDLVFLKAGDSADASRRRSYAHATGYQSPRSAVLGIRRAF